MKFSVKSLLFSICVIGILAGCDKGDDAKPLSQQQLGKLVGTWEMTSANDGTNRDDFAGIELTLSGTFNKSNPTGPYNYSFTGTFPNPSPWNKAGGSWSFVEGSEQNSIEREDEVIVSYVVSGTSLQLTFTYSGVGFPGGAARSNSVNGDWTFEFTKK
jgi:hypothetical protein